MSTISIDLAYVNAPRLLLPSSDTITLALVGCGGTGSWLAPVVARVARLLVETQRKDVRVYFIDPDHVEAKNVYRQNFCDAEIGRNKADVLALRYGAAWGLEIRALPIRFTADMIGTPTMQANWLTVLIGCVDGAPGRRELAKAMPGRGAERRWWLDCGNHQAAGQVLLGCGAKRPDDPYQLPGLCTWLPLPSVEHPELLEDEPEESMDLSTLSCAEMAMRGSQGLMINQAVAATAGDYLARMLLTNDLRKRATYLDLASGSARSKYIGEGR
jgi:PRTRC genetic system ThiF family protein